MGPGTVAPPKPLGYGSSRLYLSKKRYREELPYLLELKSMRADPLLSLSRFFSVPDENWDVPRFGCGIYCSIRLAGIANARTGITARGKMQLTIEAQPGL